MKTLNSLHKWLNGATNIAPLAIFRVGFGVMMLAGIIRFWANGWIGDLFIHPHFFFSYYGFSWVKPMAGYGMYVVFAALIVSALFVALGLFYRVAIACFFLLFTYVELIDLTNYLNHYYFISIVAGIMCLLPAHRSFSLDVKWGIAKASQTVPRWAILSLQLQLAIVYFFAGIAKINADWLLHAMPLKIWLPVRADLPLAGGLLTMPWVAYVFCWLGMLFDVLAPFFLFNKRTVWAAYGVVLVFHVLTAILFPVIGMFPFIMVVAATIFLPAAFHQRIINFFQPAGNSHTQGTRLNTTHYHTGGGVLVAVLGIHFFIQLLLPFRYLLYPGQLFYTEEGYRFSWRVMLMEKTGYATFTVRNAAGDKIVQVKNSDFITYQQEKQMSTQPDMILQFAHYLGSIYAEQFKQPQVFVEAYVTLNGRPSCLLIDPKVDLMQQHDDFSHKNWIIAPL